MKFLGAFIIVTLSVVSAEYQPRAWKSQKQTNQPPVPAASYGPPPQQEPEETTEPISTTEEPTTLEPQAENLNVKPQEPGPYFVVLPQQPNPQKYILAQPNSQLVTIRSSKLVAAAQPDFAKLPIQAVPAFARIEEFPEVVEAVEVVQAVPVASSAYTSSLYTPFSSSYIQVVQ